MTSRFAAAVESGDPDAIAAVLHPDVQFLTSNGTR
jgi:hypothetical protein